ncbi:MAG: sugar phosphate isomerase/epimerase [Lentisphaerae bacterium]|nr:sugar phosphate isomerase/epimerase [Lentisphaerota bacterium]
MKPAMITSFNYKIPFDEVLKLIHEAEFEVVALGAVPKHCGYLDLCERKTIRKQLAQYGFTIDSVHSPLPEGSYLFSLDEDLRRTAIEHCKGGIDAAEELDGKIVVLHMLQHYSHAHDEEWNKMLDEGRNSLAELSDYAADASVKLALENGQSQAYDDSLFAMLREFTESHIGFCYDVGHGHIKTGDFKVLEEFGDRLITMHMHDNDRTADQHVLPYEGNVDWKQYAKILKDINYTGNLLFETTQRDSKLKDPAEFLANAKKAGDQLMAWMQ